MWQIYCKFTCMPKLMIFIDLWHFASLFVTFCSTGVVSNYLPLEHRFTRFFALYPDNISIQSCVSLLDNKTRWLQTLKTLKTWKTQGI